MEEINFFSPASVANVSCGFDVLGFCLDPIGDEMVVRRTVAPGVKISKIEGQDLPFDVKKNVAGVAAEALLKEDCDIVVVEPNIESHQLFNIVSLDKFFDCDLVVGLVKHDEFKDSAFKQKLAKSNFLNFCGI